MAITVRFTNRNTSATGIRVYRSPIIFTSTSLPAVHDTLAPDATIYVDEGVSRGDHYFYMFEAFSASDAAFSDLLEAYALGVDSGVGPQLMIAGDHRAGFYGEVPVSESITGDALATQIGLTVGTAQHSTDPWLKFNLEGSTLLVAKRPYRHSVSWNHIHAANAVDGTQTVTLQGDQYRVRLLKGSATDPYVGGNGHDTEGTWGSEWNRLFYPLIPNPTSAPSNPSGEGIVYGSWADYTEADLGITTGNGRYAWCQERGSTGTSVFRGNSGASDLTLNNSAGAHSGYGWRPVLELVQN